MKIRLRPIQSFELQTETGEVIGVATEVATWEGMSKLVTADGAIVIIKSPGAMQEGMARALQGFGGGLGLIDVAVVRISPALAAKLTSSQGEPK